MTTQQQQILAECQTILAQCRISANQAALAASQIGDEGLATLDSPIFIGNPRAPTPPANDATASIATTAFITGQKGVPFGIPTLDNTGVVPVAQLPFTALTFDGNWNAATNSPTLSSSSGTVGHFRVVSVAGSTTLNGISSWGVGDQVLFGAGVWQKIPYTAPPISNLPLSTLAGQANNTFVGNTAGGSASPTAIPITNLLSLIGNFVGNTSGTAGVQGWVPPPPSGGTGLVLFSGGSWGGVPLPDLSAYATLANPAFSGTATVATQARGNFGSAIASTAFVLNQIAQGGTAGQVGLLRVNGTASTGSSTYGAAIDHIHGTDLSRAPVVSANPGNCGYFTFLSSTLVRFNPYNGNVIRIGGTFFVITGSGVSANNTNTFLNGLAGQNLAASTVYFVYAFNNSGTLALDFSTTTYVNDTSAGNEGTVIKSGDSTRTLVGMVRTNASSQFQSDSSHIWVISWFNKIKKFATVAVVNTTTNSTSPVDLGAGNDVFFLCWGTQTPAAGIDVNFQCELISGLPNRVAAIASSIDTASNVVSTQLFVSQQQQYPATSIGFVGALAAGAHALMAIGFTDGSDNTMTMTNGGLWVSLWG